MSSEQVGRTWAAPDVSALVTGRTKRLARSDARNAAVCEDPDGFLGRLEPEIANSFTEAQKRALRGLLVTRGASRHMVDLRHTIPFLGKRYYLAFFFGRERRLGQLTRPIGLRGWIWRYLAYLGMALFLLMPFLALAFLIRG